MKLKLWAAPLLALGLVTFAQAQEKRPEPSPDAAVRRAKPADSTAPKATLSTAGYEVFKNITIGAGQSVSMDSTLDYSAADHVAVTYRTTSNVDLTTGVLSYQAYWAVPGADNFGVAEVDYGSNFPYTNAGGSTFTAFGNQFRLVITNSTKSTITLSQVTFYMRSL